MSKTFVDQIPPETGRKYSITANPDGTSSIVDVTPYIQQGTPWGAADANQTMRKEDFDPEGRGLYAKPLRFFNTTVAASGWASDVTYAEYLYRKAVALAEVTASMVPDVVFKPDDAMGGNLAPVAVSYNGGIYLYAKAVPDAEITIPTITLWQGV